jgi:hypothetical protein
MKWVNWVEPFGPNSELIYHRVQVETAIAWMKKFYNAQLLRELTQEELIGPDF